MKQLIITLLLALVCLTGQAQVVGRREGPHRRRGFAAEAPGTLQGKVRAARRLGHLVRTLQGGTLP